MMLNTTNSKRSPTVSLRRKRGTISTRRKKRSHKNYRNGRFYCGCGSMVILFILVYYYYWNNHDDGSILDLEQKVAGKVKNVILSEEKKLIHALFVNHNTKQQTNPIINGTELIHEAESILQKRMNLRKKKKKPHDVNQNRIKVHHPRNPHNNNDNKIVGNVDKNDGMKVPPILPKNNHPNWIEEGPKIERSSRNEFLSSIPQEEKKTGGFVILGMHRSGTSMLGGLLVNGMGYHVGKPLIGEKPDNPKGFFELLPVVIQNDQFLRAQNCDWSANIIRFQPERAIQDFKNKIVPDNEMKKALAFLNNKDNYPWMQKDPRMCITLPTWLPFLDTKPAVLFTYRHPFHVALSLKHRQNMPYEQSLRIWIVYNMRAIQNSKDLCMVTSSNRAVLTDPLTEVQRISDDLTTKCNVPEPPHKLENEIVNKFVDTSLQHAKDTKKDDNKVIWMQHNGCDIEEYTSIFPTNTLQFNKEKEIYMKAMIVFCDLESGLAYKSDYVWPNLTYEALTYQ